MYHRVRHNRVIFHKPCRSSFKIKCIKGIYKKKEKGEYIFSTNRGIPPFSSSKGKTVLHVALVACKELNECTNTCNRRVTRGQDVHQNLL